MVLESGRAYIALQVGAAQRVVGDIITDLYHAWAQGPSATHIMAIWEK